ncbi:MAG: polysaccharide deacetylase family protein [Flavobacteriales bacterium]|jgi:peptidoglycan/xylan/chitin deacetylase (PgdA/CDA1 family)|nr:polysaccharide deacetylase family protein [Flavobacteriales bacterium]
MSLKKQIIQLSKKMPFIKKYFRGHSVIFMLHRVSPIDHKRLFPNENLKVSPEFLENFILEAKKKGIQFISLNELHHQLVSNTLQKSTFVITFDDGYKDNFEVAYPILKKHQIPFTIYLNTGMPERNIKMWWYALEEYLLKEEKVNINNELVSNRSTLEKEANFMKIRTYLLSLSQEEILTYFKNQNIDWESYPKELGMTWDQIRVLVNDPLVQIENHTDSHPNMALLNQENFTKEIETCNQLFSKETGVNTAHFAFPFGSDNEAKKRDFEWIKNFDFKTSVSTRKGEIYPEHKNFTHVLPRVMLHEKFSIEQLGEIRKNRIITF